MGLLHLKIKPGNGRWWRSKTESSPSSPQIHQKFIRTWNNSYRTTSEQQQKTPNFQQGKVISSEYSRAKDKGIKRDNRFQGRGLCPERGSREGGKVLTHQETSLQMGPGGSFRTVRVDGVQQWGIRGQNRGDSPQKLLLKIILQKRMGARWSDIGSDPRKKFGIGCHEDTLRG